MNNLLNNKKKEKKFYIIIMDVVKHYKNITFVPQLFYVDNSVGLYILHEQYGNFIRITCAQLFRRLNNNSILRFYDKTCLMV